jgi:PAS domain S-box-containing protein
VGRRLLFGVLAVGSAAALAFTAVDLASDPPDAGHAPRAFARQVLEVAILAGLFLLVVDRQLAHPRGAVDDLLARQRLTTVIDHLPGAAFRVAYRPDGQRRPLYISAATTRYLGITPERICAMGAEEFTDFLAPSSRGVLKDNYRQLLERGAYENIETCRAADGTLMHALVRGRLVERDRDELIAEGIAIDITAQVATRQLLESVISNLPGTVHRFHYPADGLKKLLFVDGRPVRENPAETRHLSPDTYVQMFHPDDRDFLFVQLPKLLRECHEATHTFRVSSADGGYRWMRAWERVTERNGNAFVTEGLAIDVTEEMQAHQALRETSERLSALLDNLPGMAFRVAYRPDGQRRPLYVSAGSQEYLGITPDQFCAMTSEEFTAFFDLTQREDLADGYRQLCERGRYETVLSRLRPDGSPLHLLVRGRKVGQDGDEIIAEGIAIDVTEQVATHRMLDGIARNLPGVVFRIHYPAVGPERLMFLDGAAVRAAPQDYTAMSAEQYAARFAPEERQMMFVELPRRLRAEDEAHYVHQLVDADGSPHWFRTWERVVERRGEEFFTEGLSIDVTAEMIARMALEESRARYRELIETVNVVAWEFDAADQRFAYVSPQGPALTGYTADKWGTPAFWLDRVHPEDRATVDQAFAGALADRNDCDFECRLTVAGGNVVWLGIYVHVFVKDGRPPRLRGLMVDITQRKTQEIALARLNRVLRTMDAGKEVLVYNREEGELFRSMCQVIVEVGGYSLAWVGLAEQGGAEAGAVRAVAHAGTVDDAAPACIDGPIATALRKSQVQAVDDIAATPASLPWREAALSGGHRSMIALPIKAPHELFGCLAIYAAEPGAFSADETVSLFVNLADNMAFGVGAIRERKRAEEMQRQLTQTRKMEALGQLAGSVAHDFNNLLGAILGFAGFIIEDTARTDPTYFHAGRIIAAGKRGKSLINQILSFARRGDVKAEAFSLGDMVDETGSLLAATIPATTLVTINLIEDMAAVGDRDQLGHALLNLCVNAHDALSGRPGQISVEVHPTRTEGNRLARLIGHARGNPAEAVEVWTGADGVCRAASGTVDTARRYVSMAVADQGCGMDEDLLRNIFTPFFTTKERGHGTGLGLAMVHGTVLAHGGAVLVESRPGVGTTIELILPAGDVAAARPAETVNAPTAQSVATGRVLLVDDDPDFSAMLLAALERLGHEVSPYSDPTAALADFRASPEVWDVLVTDQTMPAMTGSELIRGVRAIRPDMPCLLCTGYALDTLDRDLLEGAGVHALLRKPMDLGELRRMVASAIEEAGRPYQGR